MDNGGIADDWKPSPLPPVGCKRWKCEVIERSVKIGSQQNNTCYDAGKLGIFVVKRTHGGWDYFWVEPDNCIKLPEIDWAQVERDHIAGK